MEKIYLYEKRKKVREEEKSGQFSLSSEYFFLEEAMADPETAPLRSDYPHYQFYQEYNPENIDFSKYEDSLELLDKYEGGALRKKQYEEWVSGNLAYRNPHFGQFELQGSRPLTNRLENNPEEREAFMENSQSIAENIANAGCVFEAEPAFYLYPYGLWQKAERGIASTIAVLASEENLGVPLKTRNMPWITVGEAKAKERAAEVLSRVENDIVGYYKRLLLVRCMGYDAEPDRENPTLAKNWNIKQGTPCSNSAVIGKWGSWEKFVFDALGKHAPKTGKATLWLHKWLVEDRWLYRHLKPTKTELLEVNVNSVEWMVAGEALTPFGRFGSITDLDALAAKLVDYSDLDKPRAEKLASAYLERTTKTAAQTKRAKKAAASVNKIEEMPDIPANLRREAS